jgi:PhzF family phenazine biosynthesis protein
LKKFKFKKIDAFATENSGGNPAGCIRLDSGQEATEEEMLETAKELKGFVNEVGFLSEERDYYDLKFYSSEREVDFCGHATIAIMYDLIKNNKGLMDKQSIMIKTNRGMLKVYNKISSEDAVYIMSPVPFKKNVSVSSVEIARNLKTGTEVIDSTFPVSVINAGLTTLLVPVKNLDSVLKINPDIEILKNFCTSAKIDIIEVFTKEVSGKSSDYRTRVFAPTFGYLEDPATGSGNSAFGYYLLENGYFIKDTVVIEQNNNRNRFNIVKLKKEKDDEGADRILFGGGAVNRIEGDYFLY